MPAYFSIALLGMILFVGAPQDVPPPDSIKLKVVDDFESDETGVPPDGWRYISSNKNVLSITKALEDGEQFFVAEENGNKFVRAITRGEALRFTVRNGHEMDWDLQTHPRIQWRWRAHHLPEGASERGKNDTGAALYVTFGTDWLGRPKSIKYTYSSSLPVGTVVSFGPLKVIVVDSLNEPRTGEWKTVQRSITRDYRQVFGGDPPDRPLSITLWSDSDTTGDWAKADFDDVELLPPYRRSQ